jgi:hypothetical protein
MAIEKNIRLEPHKSRDLLVGRRSDGKRPKYQPPSQGGGHANVGGGGGNGSHDRGGRQHRTTAAKHTPTRAKDRHPGESTGRERAIANTTYNRPDRVTYRGPNVHGEGIGSQTFNKNLRTIQRRHDYNTGAYERAHPFLSKVGGMGGIFGALGRGALSFFGGIPGKLMSGIMTAKNWAKNKGTGFMKGVGEFAEYDEEGNPMYPTLDRYLNRNTDKYLNKPYRGQGLGYDMSDTGQDTAIDVPFDPNARISDTSFSDLSGVKPNNLGVNNQFVEEEQSPFFEKYNPVYPTTGLGAAEGGRIGYAHGGRHWYDQVYPFDIMPWPLKGLATHFSKFKGNDPSTWFGGMTGKSLGVLDKRNKKLKQALANKAQGGRAGYCDGGIARLL